MFASIRDASGSDEYICLYSLNLAEHGTKEYAEADFVVIGPEGVFSIEAKGGQVSRKDGVWTIGWPGSTYESSEGPFKQSESTVWPIRTFIERRTGLKRSDILVGWGVAFPHITFNEDSPDWRREVVFDERDLDSSFVTYVTRLASYYRQRLRALNRSVPPRLSPAAVQRVARALRPNISAVPTIKGLISESKRELIKLSADQFRILDFALNEQNRQIICDGSAGTGKTLIAIEAARRLAAEGKKVLLLCFNNQLGRFLSLDARGAGDRVKIATVYGFMAETIRAGGFGGHLKTSSGPTEAYFQTEYPTLFEKAAEALTEEGRLELYDAIIVDEAQDVLTAPLLNALDLVLQDGFANGRWLLCMDSALQSGVYGRLSPEVLRNLRRAKPAEFVLSQNFRNPKSVVTEICVLTKAQRPQCMRELPSNVDYRLFRDDKDQGRKLHGLLADLIRQGVSPGEITVLSAKAASQSCVARHPPDLAKPICFIETEQGRCPPDAVSAASIAGFKGLENEVIVLTDVPQIDPLSEWARSILYVGMSRARSKLYFLVDEAFLDARTRC